MNEGKVSESIFDNGSVVIPMRDVQHLEYRGVGNLMVVMKSSTWCIESGDYHNAIFIAKEQVPEFMAAWCHFRSELDSPILKDLAQ